MPIISSFYGLTIFPNFKSLNTIKGLFEQVKVDIGGYGIIWNDEIDLSCNELYENGKRIN